MASICFMVSFSLACGCQGFFINAGVFAEYLDALTENPATHIPDHCLDTSVNLESVVGRRISEAAAGRPVILLAGRIEPRKDVEEFLRLAAYSRDGWPAMFVVAGKIFHALHSAKASHILSENAPHPAGNRLVVDISVADESVPTGMICRLTVAIAMEDLNEEPTLQSAEWWCRLARIEGGMSWAAAFRDYLAAIRQNPLRPEPDPILSVSLLHGAGFQNRVPPLRRLADKEGHPQ